MTSPSRKVKMAPSRRRVSPWRRDVSIRLYTYRQHHQDACAMDALVGEGCQVSDRAAGLT